MKKFAAIGKESTNKELPTEWHFYSEDQLEQEDKKFDAIKYPKLTRDDQENVENVYATFWYYNISIGEYKYCFNNPVASTYDYHKYYEVMRGLSGYKIKDLLPGRPADEWLRRHNFHRVDKISDALKSELEAIFNIEDLNTNDCPLIYQIGLYNSDQCKEPIPEGVKIDDHKPKAPRVFFRLTNRGAFSVFVLDLYHEFYPTEDRSSK